LPLSRLAALLLYSLQQPEVSVKVRSVTQLGGGSPAMTGAQFEIRMDGTAPAATEGTTPRRPRGSSRARSRTAWSRSSDRGGSAASLSDGPQAPPIGFGSGIDKDQPDYSGWDIGDIYETCGGPDSLRWFWSLMVTGPMMRSDRGSTLQEAKAQFPEELGRLEGLGQAGRGARASTLK
jgi:hypothetical protein